MGDLYRSVLARFNRGASLVHRRALTAAWRPVHQTPKEPASDPAHALWRQERRGERRARQIAGHPRAADRRARRLLGRPDPAPGARRGGVPRRALRAITRATSPATPTCSTSRGPRSSREIHDAYFEAGADIATTNTFTATSIGQADYGLEARRPRAERRGRTARARAADEWTARTPERPRFVAGSVGPLNVTLSLSPRVDDPAYRAVTFDAVREAYAEQMRGLVDGGVDLLLIETIFDTLNAKAAIVGRAGGGAGLPLWLSFTAIDRSGRNLSGQTVEAFWTSVEHADPLVVGVNCSLGAAQMRPFVEDLARVAHDLRRPATRTPACRTRSAATTSSRPTRAASSASSRRPGSSTSSAAAAARRPSTSGRSRPRSRRRAAAGPDPRAPAALQRARAVRDRARTPAS